jgi:hypothetical protein
MDQEPRLSERQAPSLCPGHGTEAPPSVLSASWHKRHRQGAEEDPRLPHREAHEPEDWPALSSRASARRQAAAPWSVSIGRRAADRHPTVIRLRCPTQACPLVHIAVSPGSRTAGRNNSGQIRTGSQGTPVTPQGFCLPLSQGNALLLDAGLCEAHAVGCRTFVKRMLDFVKRFRRLPLLSQGNSLLFDAGLCREHAAL